MIDLHDNKVSLPMRGSSTLLLQEVVGHNLSLSAIQRAVNSDRLHHAYLFHGPEGVGKKRSALSIARLLLCLHPQSVDNQREACGACKSCQRVKRYILGESDAFHPDLHLITRQRDSGGKLAKEIKIAPVRELQSALNLGAFEGGCSVVVIEDVDRLGLSAANALLKTLEEPLPNVYFFLTTSSLNAVLPTIISRAQSLRFAALNTKTLHKLLLQLESMPEAPEGGRALNEVQRESIAQLSGGSLGRAISLWENGGMEKVESLIKGSDLNGGPQDLLSALNFAKSFEKSSEEEISLWIHLLRCWYRDALVLLHGANIPSLFFPAYQEYTTRRAQHLGAQRLLWRLQALDEGERHMLKRTGSNRKLIMETLCLYLAGFDAINARPLQLSS